MDLDASGDLVEMFEDETRTACDVDGPMEVGGDVKVWTGSLGSKGNIVWCFRVHWRQFPDEHLFKTCPFRRQLIHNFNLFASFYLIEGAKFENKLKLVIKWSAESQKVYIGHGMVAAT